MMRSKLSLSIFLAATLSSCASHQYSAMTMDETKSGINYRIDSGTLTIQYQEYQFWPDTAEILVKCRAVAKQAAQELNVMVSDFDYMTERNKAISTTSCVAIGDIK